MSALNRALAAVTLAFDAVCRANTPVSAPVPVAHVRVPTLVSAPAPTPAPAQTLASTPVTVPAPISVPAPASAREPAPTPAPVQTLVSTPVPVPAPISVPAPVSISAPASAPDPAPAHQSAPVSISAPATVPAPTPTPPPGQLDEVLVIGRHPGPGMWRVSRGGHDLWILATLEPLPKGLLWDAAEVEQRIAHSAAVLEPPRVDAHIGFFRGLTLLPSLLRAKRSPDGRTLEQAVPHDLYMRWLALRVKYLGNSSDEQLRPMLAALDLFLHALDQTGLTNDTVIWKRVEQIAHQSRVPIESVVLDLKIRGAGDYVRDLTQIPSESELACLRSTIEHLENDLPAMRERANLWSLGNVERLQPLLDTGEPVACFDALLSVPQFKEEYGAASKALDALWLAKAEEALRDHSSTVAVVSIEKLLASGGWLDHLRALGYEIEAP
jgi:hypothetical protein